MGAKKVRPSKLVWIEVQGFVGWGCSECAWVREEAGYNFRFTALEKTMPASSPQVFICPRKSCCRGWPVPIILPRESSLGRYAKKEYSPTADAWPFKFVCFECGRKSEHFKEEIQLANDQLDQSYFDGKCLWRVRLWRVDSKPDDEIYTIASCSFDCELLAEHFFPPPETGTIQHGDFSLPSGPPQQVTAASYPYNFWPPSTRFKIL